MAQKPIPVILDTDIGSDIDDTWALAMLLKCPELDLKLVTTARGNTTYRAQIVARMLEVAGRTDIPIGVGIHQGDEIGPQAPFVEGYDLSSYPGRVYEDGVQALVDTAMTCPETPALVAIGPLPNVAAALDREPRLAAHARFVGMHGSVRRGYSGAPEISKEWNVVADPASAQKVFTAAWDMAITPLDTCGIVQLKGEKYQAIANSADPLTKAVIENYTYWGAGGAYATHESGQSSILFDAVAIYLAYAQDLCRMEQLGIRVEDDGRTVEDPAAKPMSVATEWRDLEAFEDLLVEIYTKR